MSREPVTATEVFKALGDPIRWSIVQQVARQDEFPCSVLEDTLPVSKPTISYHTKILTQAGLIEVHKRGRHYFYSLRRDVLREVLGELWTLAPAPDLVGGVSEDGDRNGDRGTRDRSPLATAPGETDPGAAVLTW
ncbi:ArsR/SmtB family transcription factor [Spirillospora sp. CA-255316]